MTPMEEILIRHGSDKSTWHQYHAVYESLFPDRESVQAVLELGVAYGASLLAWREIFPNAVIVGLDLDPCVPCPRLSRMEVYQGDQRDRDVLRRIAGGRQFDLMIDDASHKIADQLTSLFWLWPFLRPGGCYVVEEFDVQDGRGPADGLACFGLLRGSAVYKTPSPNGQEILLVVRKEQP